MKVIARHILRSPVYFLLSLYKAKLVSFTSVSQMLAFIPGSVGAYLRDIWYRHTLSAYGKDVFVDWMAAFKTPRASVGNNVYIGPFCWLGWARIGNDVMLGGHISVLSGSKHHGFDRLDVPMTRQEGKLTEVRIEDDVWVGSRAVIMADVSSGSVVAAGAIVTKTCPPQSILAGVPAKVISVRR